MNRITIRAASLMVATVAAFTSAGCDEGDDGMVGGKAYPPTGSTVHVQFRRDYLGMAANSRSEALGAMGEGAPQPVAASGVLRQVGEEFIVLQVGEDKARRELWIPRDAVLMLDVTRPADD